MTPIEGPVPLRVKLIAASGSLAFGIKDSGFSFFLLLFYNQVMGMDAGAVSLALMVALIFDALVDPLIGNLSDRTYTRWGRRLPWLYAAPIPLAFAWVLLWSPPGGATPSFWELLAIAVSVRLLLSACEIPSVSLIPEITHDYDERTTLFRFRYVAGWGGGVLMMMLAYTVFLPGPDGLLQRGGYLPFGIFGGVVMAASVIGSAAGLHRLVAHLPPQKPAPFSFRTAFSEIADAFSERAFLIFAAGGAAAYISQGMNFSISNYLNLYVWQMSGAELIGYPVTLFISVAAMFFIVGPLHRRWGKPKTAASAAIGSIAAIAIPYSLMLAGIWPDITAEPEIFGAFKASTLLFFAFLFVGNTLGIVVMISATSMVAEIVEAYQMRGGRRSEGVFYSGNWLVQKCATGLGLFVTGQIVAASQLPDAAKPGTVTPEVISHIVVYYLAASAILAIIAAFWLMRFPIGREDHEARLAALDAMARGNIDGGPTGV